MAALFLWKTLPTPPKEDITCVDYIKKEFPGAYLYYYHRNKEHAATVFCDMCNIGFKTKEKLRVHKINKH